MEMQQLEVMKTKTRGFDKFIDALRYIIVQEADGWAVRQIAIVPYSKATGSGVFVVLEDNR